MYCMGYVIIFLPYRPFSRNNFCPKEIEKSSLGNFIKGIKEGLYTPNFLELQTKFGLKNKNYCDSKKLRVYKPCFLKCSIGYFNSRERRLLHKKNANKIHIRILSWP